MLFEPEAPTIGSEAVAAGAPANLPAPEAPTPLPAILYVATNLESFGSPSPSVYASDVRVSGRAFRRLDPLFWAWLRRRVDQARDARDSGRVSPESFAGLLLRWSRVHAWAFEEFSDNQLREAVQQLAGGHRYMPPDGAKSTRPNQAIDRPCPSRVAA